jgi:hypothetical protein
MSAAMPMPVSRTEKRRTVAGGGWPVAGEDKASSPGTRHPHDDLAALGELQGVAGVPNHRRPRRSSAIAKTLSSAKPSRFV